MFGVVVGWFLGLDGVVIFGLVGVIYIFFLGVIVWLLEDLCWFGNWEMLVVLLVLVFEDFVMVVYLLLFVVFVIDGSWFEVVVGMMVVIVVLFGVFVVLYCWGYYVGWLVIYFDFE